MIGSNAKWLQSEKNISVVLAGSLSFTGNNARHISSVKNCQV